MHGCRLCRGGEQGRKANAKSRRSTAPSAPQRHHPPPLPPACPLSASTAPTTAAACRADAPPPSAGRTQTSRQATCFSRASPRRWLAAPLPLSSCSKPDTPAPPRCCREGKGRVAICVDGVPVVSLSALPGGQGVHLHTLIWLSLSAAFGAKRMPYFSSGRSSRALRRGGARAGQRGARSKASKFVTCRQQNGRNTAPAELARAKMTPWHP